MTIDIQEMLKLWEIAVTCMYAKKPIGGVRRSLHIYAHRNRSHGGISGSGVLIGT